MEQNALDTAVRKFASTVAAYNATQVEYDKNVKARVKGVLKTERRGAGRGDRIGSEHRSHPRRPCPHQQ